MNLKQIDERLVLYKEYLKYWIDVKINNVIYFDLSNLPDITVATMMSMLAEQGFMLVNSKTPTTQNYMPLTFDQWLYENKHNDLVIEPITYKIGNNTFSQYKINGFTYNLMHFEL